MKQFTGILAFLTLFSFVPGLAWADAHKDQEPPARGEVRDHSIDMATKGSQAMRDALVNGSTDQQEIAMYGLTDKGTGKEMGTITAKRTPYGVLFEPQLTGLSTGVHGFHLHENADCGPSQKEGNVTPGGAAGGHLNPLGGEHNGPYRMGHLGDLPALYADEDGKVTVSVLAPRLEFGDLKERALIIHKGGDNYSSEPEPLGGGGPRVACGIIQ